MQKDTTISDHGVLEYALITNKRFWSSLPDDIRLELEKIIKEVAAKVTQFALDAAIKDMKTIADSGKTNIHILTPEQKTTMGCGNETSLD